MAKIICELCGQSFIPHGHNQKYCSEPCKNESDENYRKAYYEAYREKINKVNRLREANKRFHFFEAIYDNTLTSIKEHVNEEFRQEYIVKCQEIWEKIKKKTKYRSPRYCGSIFIYLFFKSKGISINKSTLKAVYKINEKEFRRGMRVLIPLFKEYCQRDKKKHVIKQIFRIAMYFELDTVFIRTAQHIINVFWSYLETLKEETIAGVILLLSLVKMQITSLKFLEVCKILNADASTVYNAINTQLFNESEGITFRGFRKSSQSVKTFLDERLATATG
ncbi:hypothetical protein ES703_52836 [subsurface metagenome]